MGKKFKLTNEVANFTVGGKDYRPGEIVEVPDSFPAHLYKFLQPLGEVVEEHREGKPAQKK